MLSKRILIVKTIREKNLKIQMLAGNSLNSFFDASFKKTTTLSKLLRPKMSRLAEWAADYGAFKLYQQSLGRKWFRFELWIKFEYIMGILSYHGRSNTIFLQEDILDSSCLPTLEEMSMSFLWTDYKSLQISKPTLELGTIYTMSEI